MPTSLKTKRKKNVDVEISIDISYDEAKFTPAFMASFREGFYPFDTINEHIEFIAEQIAVGNVNSPTSFLEGYGVLSEFGISWKWGGCSSFAN